MSKQSKNYTQQWAFCPKFHNILTICQKVIWGYGLIFRGYLCVWVYWNQAKGVVGTVTVHVPTRHHHCRLVVSHVAAAGEEWVGGSKALLCPLHF
jgi:hypothetical protein